MYLKYFLICFFLVTAFSTYAQDDAFFPSVDKESTTAIYNGKIYIISSDGYVHAIK